jgi:hypothetical protein
VGKVGGDRKSEKSLTKSSFLISDPQRRFAGYYRANEKYAQQAYALVTRDPFSSAGKISALPPLPSSPRGRFS